MKVILRLQEMEDALRLRARLFIGRPGEQAREIDVDKLMEKPFNVVMKLIIDRELYYDDDPEGRETLIIRKFEDEWEMHEFLRDTDIKKMEKELFDQYGPSTGFMDTKEMQFCITRAKKNAQV